VGARELSLGTYIGGGVGARVGFSDSRKAMQGRCVYSSKRKGLKLSNGGTEESLGTDLVETVRAMGGQKMPKGQTAARKGGVHPKH